ncbi:uncharacterized protein [Trachinotus anak]|uniref:uncharacterized protein isoform X3 n=1 Tax=Trachinotus anak TaxID=443729 RepID=UPI0039F25C93
MNLFQSGRQILNGILNPPAADIKHHGLLNQGATCYLNSVLQVLFMTEDFREAVERYICENPGTEFIDRQLKDLFDDLKERNTYTYKITKKLGIYRVYEQQDAAEYFEKILALTSSEASQIFHGQLTHKTICSECLTERNTDGPFWHLPLELVDPGSKDYSVVDGTKEYFTASHFSGENQMYCEHCDAKSDATIRCVVKHHPEVLMLLLKRFEFNYRYMTYVKNNCVVDVPYTLQIPENQTYELYAVVDHYGDLRGGHYAATVKSQHDERWYNFNDDQVTLLDNQPFQVDNTEISPTGSCSAYLLFYRKKEFHAADTCTQDREEASINGGVLPVASDNDDQCQDAEEIKERKEADERVEVGNDTSDAVSIDRNGETGGIRDMVSVRSVVDVRQIQKYNDQEDHEEGSGLRDQDAHSDKCERDETRIIRDNEEENNTEANEQEGKRGSFLTETEPGERVEDQDYRAGQDDFRLNRPQEGLEGKVMHNTSYNDQKCEQEVSNMLVGHDYPQQVQTDMLRGEKRIREENGKTEGDEQSDKKGKYLNRDTKPQVNEGLDVDKHINDYEGGKQEVRKGRSRHPLSVDEKGDEEEKEIDVKDDKGGKTGADKLIPGKGKLSTRPDHDCHEFKNHGRVGDRKQDVSKGDRGRKQGGSSRSFERCELKKEVRKDVKSGMEQKRSDDEPAQKRGASERGQHCGQDVEDQNHGADVRPNRPEQKISVRHKNVGLEKQVKESKSTGDTHHIQPRQGSSLGQAGLTERGRQTEKQRVDSVEKTRQGNSQSKARTYFKGVRVEGVKEKQRSSKRKAEEKITQDNKWANRRGSIERQSDPKLDGKVTLRKGVSNINLNDSPLPEPQKHRPRTVSGNVQQENETDIVLCSNAKIESDAQIQAGRKHALKKVGALENIRSLLCLPPRKRRQKKTKQNKTIGCFSMFQRKQKNADQNTEPE